MCCKLAGIHLAKARLDSKFKFTQPLETSQEVEYIQPLKSFQPIKPSQVSERQSETEISLKDGQSWFVEWVQTYQTSLKQYCRSLAGSAWEAEELAQETWLKVWKASLEKGKFNINKSYLYKVANHIYIDRHRKKSVEVASNTFDQFAPLGEHTDVTSLWIAMEALVCHLPVNQRTALLLVDVFRYTATETAEMLHTTEGAVKALLHRARMKLRSKRQNLDPEMKEGQGDNPHYTVKVDDQIVYAYLKAFREQNPYALLVLMNESKPLDHIQPPVFKHGKLKQHDHPQYQHRSYATDYIGSLAMVAA